MASSGNFDIFMSYNHGSKTEAQSMYLFLSKQFKIWKDNYELLATDLDIYQVFAQNIATSRVFMCFITKKYAESPNCIYEITTAFLERKPIIAIMLENHDVKELGVAGIIITNRLRVNAFADPKFCTEHTGENIDLVFRSIQDVYKKDANNKSALADEKDDAETTKRVIEYLKSHANYKLPFYAAAGKKIYVSSFDAMIDINKLEGHKGNVTCLEMTSDESLASGSEDKTIKIWDLSKFACVKTLEGHTGCVKCLKRTGKNFLASGGSDCVIRIWNLKKFECTDELKAHTGSVTSLEVFKDKIVSTSWDKTIILWSVNLSGKARLVNKMCGHNGAVTCLLAFSGKLVSASVDHTIRVWNGNAEIKKFADGSFKINCMLKLTDNVIASGCKNGLVKIWYLDGKKDSVSIKAHEGEVLTLEKMNLEYFASGGDDGLIKFWRASDFKLHKIINTRVKSGVNFILKKSAENESDANQS